MRRPIAGFLVSCVWIGSAGAEEKIALRDALQQAVKANPTLVTAGIDVAIADAQVTQAEGVDDFVIDANASIFFDRTEPVAGQPFNTTAIDRLDLGGGISRNLGSGGRVGLRVDHLYQRSITEVQFAEGAPAEEFESTTHSPSVTVTFFQPILRGFGDDNPVRVARRRALAQRTVDELERGQVASEVVRDVVQAYWELAYAQRDVEIRRASLALAREQLRITQARLDVGVGAPSDLAAVEQTIAFREEEVLLAEVAISERALELRRLTGMEISATAMALTAIDRPEATAAPVTMDAAMQAARTNNPQIAVFRARGSQAEIEVDVTENGLLPQLDFDAQAGPAGDSAELGDALAQVGKFDSYSVRAGLVFSMPLGNRAARGAHEAAKGNLRRVRVSQAEVEAQIGVAVARAVNSVSSAQKRMQVLQTATRSAEVNLDAEKARFDVGHSTNFDVLMRQDELAQSQLRQARAQVDYLRALAVLQALTGEILPAYGVEIKKR
jgi:outer membrane protein TolC